MSKSTSENKVVVGYGECLTCGGRFELVGAVARRATGKVKRFCGDKCNDDWWNGQRDHPVWEKVGADWEGAKELREMRNVRVAAEMSDPWRYGYEPDHWKVGDRVWGGVSEMLLSGGNRAGKTLWAARECVRMLLGKVGANVLCCHTSNATSVTVQQPAVYRYLPPELRVTKKGRVHYLNYSMKNGFTDGSFILPNMSRCDFLNYTQSQNTIEGREVDLVWCDELVPASWVETLRYRLSSRRGKLLVTQTPLEGVASVFKEFVAGGRIVEWGDADLLVGKGGQLGWPDGKAPRVMERARKGKGVVYFFTKDNPFNPFDEMEAKLRGAPVGQILVRAYGWATDNIGKAFGRFRGEVHCIPKSKVPEGGTLYMVMDPAGARNWFALWALVYEDGKVIVVREFPDLPGYGEWALPGDKSDGKVGPAQFANSGRGLAEYRQLFRDIEEEIGRGEPMTRLIDPKAGGTPAVSEAGGDTLIDLLAETSDGSEGMVFLPAPGVHVDQRIAAINSALSFDSTSPMSAINEPKLYVVDECYNLIWCLAEHTGRDGQKGASKDPIDCLGMLLTSSCDYVAPGGMNSYGGGSY